jgi:hypothetical protein
MHDTDWDNRESKSIQLEMNISEAANLFVDNAQWSIIEEIEDFERKIEEIINEETGELERVPTLVPTIITREHDNSEFDVAGDIIDHRNGMITIKMGKPTAEELLSLIEEVL